MKSHPLKVQCKCGQVKVTIANPATLRKPLDVAVLIVNYGTVLCCGCGIIAVKDDPPAPRIRRSHAKKSYDKKSYDPDWDIGGSGGLDWDS